jgi:hypothetical protein
MSEHNPYGPTIGAYQPGQGPPSLPYGYPQPQPQPTNTMAVLALVFAFVFSPLGIVFGAIGLQQTRRRAEGGRGLALSGLILGSIFTALGIIVLVVTVVVISTGPQVFSADSPSDIAGVTTYEYAAGRQHVQTPVTYTEAPPVGGPHDPYWADCTGTVYTVDIRHENAVHSLEHGAVWITYNPDQVSQSDIDTLAALVDGQPGRMLSPYAGQDSAISLQSWNHHLEVDSAGDKRIKQFADLMTFNSEVDGHYPEIGASCENPAFKANPVVADD